MSIPLTDLGSALDAFLDCRPAPPRLLGLGEPLHGAAIFPEFRNRVLRHLVTHHGYRSIAIESDAVAGLVVDEYVTAGIGELDQVMATGFSHGLGTVPANRELVGWLRKVNADRAPDDRVRFHGFAAPPELTSVPSPRAALTELHDYLAKHLPATRLPYPKEHVDALLGPDNGWTNPAALLDAGQSVGRSAPARELRVVVDDLITVLDAEAPGLHAAAGPDAHRRAHLFARTARGLLRCHDLLADPGVERVARLLAARDGMMADNLSAIAAAEARRGPTLVFAHNGHLQRTPTERRLAELDLRWWSAGAITGTRLGTDYALIAGELASAPELGLAEPAPDTFQGVLARDSGPAGGLFGVDMLAERPAARTDAPVRLGYQPLSADALSGIDAIAFLRR